MPASIDAEDPNIHNSMLHILTNGLTLNKKIGRKYEKNFDEFKSDSKTFDTMKPSKKEKFLAYNAQTIIMARYDAAPNDPVNKAAKEALDEARNFFNGAATENQKKEIVINMVAIVAAMDGDTEAYDYLHKKARKMSEADSEQDRDSAKASAQWAQRWDRTKGILIRVGIALAVGAAVAFMVICPPAAALAFVALVTPFAIQAAAIAVSAASVFLANMAGNVVIALAALCAIKVGGKMMGNETPLKDFFKGIAHGVAWVLKLPSTAVDSVAEFVSPSKKGADLGDTSKVEAKMSDFEDALNQRTPKARDSTASRGNFGDTRTQEEATQRRTASKQ